MDPDLKRHYSHAGNLLLRIPLLFLYPFVVVGGWLEGEPKISGHLLGLVAWVVGAALLILRLAPTCAG